MKLPILNIKQEDLDDTLIKTIRVYNFLLRDKLYRLTDSEQKLIIFYIKNKICFDLVAEEFGIKRNYFLQTTRKFYKMGWLVKDCSGRYILNKNLTSIQKEYKNKTLNL